MKKLGEGGMGGGFIWASARRLISSSCSRSKRLNASRPPPPPSLDTELARHRAVDRANVCWPSLRHSHSPSLLTVARDADGTPYVAMEYVDGVPLLEHVPGQ